MTYALYYARGSAAMGVRVILEEIGAQYELIQTTIDMDKPRPPKQLALNPNGWVPVLIWDAHAMYEWAAITIFLCDRHPEAGLAQPPTSLNVACFCKRWSISPPQYKTPSNSTTILNVSRTRQPMSQAPNAVDFGGFAKRGR